MVLEIDTHYPAINLPIEAISKSFQMIYSIRLFTLSTAFLKHDRISGSGATPFSNFQDFTAIQIPAFGKFYIWHQFR